MSQIKKYSSFVLIVCLCFSNAKALDVCAKTNAYIASYVFSRSINGTLGDVNNGDKTWSVIYEYGTVTGNASCNGISGQANTVNTQLLTNAQDVGIYCWCQMYPIKSYSPTTPVTSYWVYLKDFSNSNDCESDCNTSCGNAMATNSDYRTAIFTSIW